MTIYKFAIIKNMRYSQFRAFRIWLADLKDNVLPENEWERLWEEFNS